MRKNKVICSLLPLFLLLSGCTGVSEKYDIDKPSIGFPSKSCVIELNDGSKATITNDMDTETAREIFLQLKSFDGSGSNWDSKISIKGDVISKSVPNSDEDVYKKISYDAYKKVRVTNDGDKHGYYTCNESNGFKEIIVSTSPNATQYTAFTYTKENGKLVALYGNVRPQEFFDSLSSTQRELYPIPGCEAGTYTRSNLPIIYQYEDYYNFPSKGYIGYTRMRALFDNTHFYFMDLAPFEIDGIGTLTPTFTFSITNKYLAIHIDYPYGLSGNFLSPMAAERRGITTYSMENKFYRNEDLLFDISTGKLSYYRSSFKCYYRMIGRNLEGTMIIKAQPDSTEAYEKLLETRDYVISKSTDFEPFEYKIDN